MKIQHVTVEIIKQMEGKRIVESEVFLHCGKPYMNYGFHVEGNVDLEPGVYTLNFEPQPKARAAKG